jgi:hypothetical protein
MSALFMRHAVLNYTNVIKTVYTAVRVEQFK